MTAPIQLSLFDLIAEPTEIGTCLKDSAESESLWCLDCSASKRVIGIHQRWESRGVEIVRVKPDTIVWSWETRQRHSGVRREARDAICDSCLCVLSEVFEKRGSR